MTKPADSQLTYTRRQILRMTSGVTGVAALASLVGTKAMAERRITPGLPDLPHFTPRAKRIIYLFQHGAPSQLDMFDYKPALLEKSGTKLPDSVRKGQRLTAMSNNMASLTVAPSRYKFKQHGESGAWVSELLPHTAKVADHLCFIKTMHTEAINHDPGCTFAQTGTQLVGRPSIGSWMSYGMGSENADLPTYMVLLSKGPVAGQTLAHRFWGNGFLPSTHQGVALQSSGDPVLYLSDPPGFSRDMRRRYLDHLGELNRVEHGRAGDPEIETRISQYEMAFRMQSSVPELADVSSEPDHVFDMYGPDSRTPGTYAANCLLARRLCERGVRFVQLFHRGWDHHNNLPKDLPPQCQGTDQPSAALVKDLHDRGLLEDTLVVWGGEFGRTVYSQGRLEDDFGRDHHPRCFTMWVAGGGIKGGISYGKTDDYCYNVVENPVSFHDLHATLLHCLGIDHENLTFPFQGRDFRLTDVEGIVQEDILA